MTLTLRRHTGEPRETTQAGTPAIGTTVLAAALLAVAAELLVQRLLVRIGVHIPALPFLRGPYEVATEAGAAAFVAATLLVGAALAATLWALRERMPAGAGAALAAAVTPFPLVGLALGLSGSETGWESRLALLYLVAVAVAGAALLAAARGTVRACSAVLTLSLAVGALVGTPALVASGQGVALARLGEAGMLFAALLTPVAFAPRRPVDRQAAVIGLAAGGTTFAAQMTNASTTNIVMLWGLGLTGTLPFFAYGGAVTALVFAVVCLVKEGRTPTAAALLFVAMGGYGMHNTYQSTVQLLGLCALTAALMGEGEARIDPADGPLELSRAASA